MNKNRILLIIQAVFCVLSALVLIAADLSIYFEGLALKEENPMAAIYSAEAVAERAVYVVPILIAAVIVTMICGILGVRDKRADKPAAGIDIKKNTAEGRTSPAATGIIRGIVIAAAIICIIAGILNGSMQDVLIKATKICTECIGLG